MIRSFACKETQKLFEGERSGRFPAAIQRRARRKLDLLAASPDIESLRRTPGNRLERLKGDRRGQYSIRINERWRLCLRWRRGDAHEVQIADYH